MTTRPVSTVDLRSTVYSAIASRYVSVIIAIDAALQPAKSYVTRSLLIGDESAMVQEVRSPLTRTRGQQVLLWIGSLGPLGYCPASGTLTVAVVGVPLFAAMHRMSVVLYGVITLAVLIAAVWLHSVGDRLLAEKDSRRLVWDEIVGFLIAVIHVPFTWQLAVTAFVLERILDIGKIPPARCVERRIPGGWGVVGDDVVAGLYTCGVLHLLMEVAPGLFAP